MTCGQGDEAGLEEAGMSPSADGGDGSELHHGGSELIGIGKPEAIGP